MKTEWRQEDDGTPSFGRKGKAWLRLAIYHWLTTRDATGSAYLLKTDQDMAAILDWFIEDWKTYVKWNPEEEYRGNGFPPVFISGMAY